MPLREILRKKDRHEAEISEPPSHGPQVMIMRSDTNTQEIISDPLSNDEPDSSTRRSRFRSLSSASTSPGDKHEKFERRLSSIFNIRPNLKESRRASVNLPTNLPDIDDKPDGGEEKEAQWEKRATILIQDNPTLESLGLGRKPTVIRKISDAKGDDDIRKAIELHEAGNLTASTAMFGRLADPGGENNALSQVLYGLALRLVYIPDSGLQLSCVRAK